MTVPLLFLAVRIMRFHNSSTGHTAMMMPRPVRRQEHISLQELLERNKPVEI